MNKKIKWLHVSDFHYGKAGYDQELMTKKILEHVASNAGKGFIPDLIFVTGDVANSGKPEEYKAFTNQFISPLTDFLGYEYLDRIFVVPGNHDLNREINDGFSRDKFLKVEGENFHPTEKSRAKRNMLVERFGSFIDGIPLDCVKEFKKDASAYTALRLLNGVNVNIAGINTAWLCEGDSDKNYLTPGVATTRELLEQHKKERDCIFLLGHHPLDWLHINHATPIQSVLADHAVIYLHGHMHQDGIARISNGAGEFVTFQAGAAWQAPEGSKWKNGLLWGEFDLVLNKIALQPFHWNFENQCWTLDGTRFHENYRIGDRWEFEAPRLKIPGKVDYTPKIKTANLTGWEIKTLDMLSSCSAPLLQEDAIAFFDGAIPSWNVALSQTIPRREIVQKLEKCFDSAENAPTVGVLLGAGCEGKTTAILQAALEVLKKQPSKKLLYRTNHTRAFESSELIDVLRSHDDWLILIDEADQVARDVLRFIDLNFEAYDGKIDFLLASRDSDWRSSGACDLAWGFKAKYKEITLKDLSQIDSIRIVEAWQGFGAAGLGEELAALPAEQRAEKLRFYAKKEAKGNSDAFYGALLMCRHGGDLLEHAESMLNKLAVVELDSGMNLKDVLGYIAAMHAEGFSKLTFSGLAALVNLSIPKLQSEVIRRLGKEAAATSTSTNIFTRHKYIAEAIVEVLENKFDEDISKYFIELAVSEATRSKKEYVLDLPFWRFEMAELLFARGKSRLATDITERLLQADDTNYHLLTKLASYYRRQDGARNALALFRNFPSKPKHRGFYFEWGVCEGIERNISENAFLAAFALSDDVEETSITVGDARVYLTGLATSCAKLYTAYAERLFSECEDAAYSLLVLLKTTSAAAKKEGGELDNYIQGVKKNRRRVFNRSQSINTISAMLKTLHQYGMANEVKSLAPSLTFFNLDRIIKNVEEVALSH